MKLYVCLLEGRDWPVKDSYVKLKVGKHKSKTRFLKNTQNPLWNEEFAFRVSDDLDDELVVSVYTKHDDHEPPHGLFFSVSGGSEIVGQVKIPLRSIAAEENRNLPPTWFSLERPKNSKLQDKETFGTLLLSLSLHGEGLDGDQQLFAHTNSANSFKVEENNSGVSTAALKKALDAKHLMKSLTGRLDRLFHKKHETNHNDQNSSEVSTSTLSEYEDPLEEPTSSSSFEELLELMQTKSENVEMPDDLHGGVLLDQTYVTSPEDLNMFIFSPDSKFIKDLAEIQGTLDIHEEPWKLKSEGPSLTRVVTYTRAASKLIKAVKATETQTYIKAAGREFAVSVSVNTPDVPYGSTFLIELLYKIMPGKESSAGEDSAHLVISWAVNFCQNTMMKGMIENGAKQGLKESFDQFARLLSQSFKVLTVDTSGKDHMLATLETEQRSDWELKVHYFWNFTVLSTIFMCVYVLVHIFLCEPNKLQGLEFAGLDLPDSFGEIITCGILVIQLERVYNMLSHFVEARLRRGSDHGIKAQGDGWVLTVGLIEGVNLSSLNSTEIPDPYVVFTCNGKTRTSSVKLQTLDPQWNEILEFDAAEEPPAMLDVEVFDFDGPFDQASSLGHCEINFLKHSAEELADLWVNLNGKLAQSSQSKLHLRVFLDNNNGVETIRDYLSNLEREVGKKLNLRSPHRNSAFQKVFGLPPEEFLISDFSCSLKRRMPLQGRLFLSARIVGFYANLFGHKTKFYFLWEDIEDIQVLPPSLAAVGSPSIEIILHKGRGIDARDGAKLLDEEGRLHFYFHSFVSFGDASRTIMGLWRTRTLEDDEKAHVVVEQQQDEEKPCLDKDSTGSYLVVEDVKMTKAYSVELPMNLESLMKMFDGGELELRVMGKSGCINYVTTAWEQVKPDLQERRVSYKFSRRISIFGGEVTCTQQKSPMPDNGGWVVNEIMTLHGVPLCDQFRVQFRYQIENSSFTHTSCKCSIYIGVVWLKNTHFEPRITKNINDKFSRRLEEILQLVEKEILLTNNL